MVGNDTIHTVTRKEHDCIGYMDVPKDVYWGIHTQRALGNFTVSRIADSTHPQLMRAYATVKRACAEANDELGLIDHDKARRIVAACHDVENGELADQFPVDVLQGGAGTSTNMNMNEVIANRALELGGHPKGDYGFIHPNDDVNHSQSTNDTYPAACKLALIDAIGPLAEETKKLTRAFHDLADKHTNDVTIGRTQLQDAVPMTYGQEFHAFASFLKSDLLALEHVVPQLTTLNLGATAIGTGICADLRFRTTATRHLAAITGLPITAASAPVAAQMALGAAKAAGADIAVSVTGLAGPGGGDAVRPVGTVYLGAARGDKAYVKKLFVSRPDRALIRARAAQTALEMALRLAPGKTPAGTQVLAESAQHDPAALTALDETLRAE